MKEQPGKNDRYKRLSDELEKIICSNIKKLYEAEGLTQTAFCDTLKRKSISVSRPYYNKIDKGYGSCRIPFTFILVCCDYFQVTLEEMMSPDFDASKHKRSDVTSYKNYLNIEELLVHEKNAAMDRNNNSLPMASKEANNIPLFLSDDNLITKPDNSLFKGYLQKYFCYYYPTHSSENKEKLNIIKGTLELKDAQSYCKATLQIDTNTLNDRGEPNIKKYTGYAVISVAVKSLYCILYSKDQGEFCFIMFRHFKLNFKMQECRIAEVLSASSAGEDRRPTVLRMFLSREEIRDDDLKLISPSFALNYSSVVIEKEKLESLGSVSEEYALIVEQLLTEKRCEAFKFKEKDIINTASRYLNSDVEILEFLMNFRKLSCSYRYNKVGSKTDEQIRKILLEKGYYNN